MNEGAVSEIGGRSDPKVVKRTIPTAFGTVAGGTMFGEEVSAIVRWRHWFGFPGLGEFVAFGEGLHSALADEVDKVFATGVAFLKEVTIRGHWGFSTERLWVDEVLLEPGPGAAIANVEEIGTGASVADDDGRFLFDFSKGKNGTPEFHVDACRSDVTGVAVDAAFGEVDLAASVDGGPR